LQVKRKKQKKLQSQVSICRCFYCNPKGALRPVFGLDVRNRQESNWDADVSARAGIQFENPDFLSRKLQLLFEYYNGKSPNGQFYERNIEFFGLGLHFFPE
jgi:hypothetical protein